MTYKTYSQSEVDALVAAERTLFAQKVAEHIPYVHFVTSVQRRIGCICGFIEDDVNPLGQWRAHILVSLQKAQEEVKSNKE